MLELKRSPMIYTSLVVGKVSPLKKTTRSGLHCKLQHPTHDFKLHITSDHFIEMTTAHSYTY